MLRRVIAAFGHAPALWLVYREALPKVVRRPNAFAAVGTVLAMVVAGVATPADARWAAVFWTWIVGHFAWGAYLFVKLPDPE